MPVQNMTVTLPEKVTLDPCDSCGNGSTRSYFRVIFDFGKFDFCRHHFLKNEKAVRDQGASVIDYSDALD